jgi:hypothetical protein
MGGNIFLISIHKYSDMNGFESIKGKNPKSKGNPQVHFSFDSSTYMLMICLILYVYFSPYFPKKPI